MSIFPLRTLFMLFILSWTSLVSSQNKTPESFQQEVQMTIELPDPVLGNLIGLTQINAEIIGITTRGTYSFDQKIWMETQGQEDIALYSSSNDELWLASDSKIFKASGETLVDISALIGKKEKITALFWLNEQTLYIGTTQGLIICQEGQLQWHTELQSLTINDIAKTEEALWYATNTGLWKETEDQFYNLDYVIMADGHQRNYLSLAVTEDKKDLIFSSPLAIGCIAQDGEHWQYTGAEGLPYGPATQIVLQNENIWLATERGAIKKDKNWHYYLGNRWLVDDKVVDLLVLNDSTIWIASPNGISEIKEIPMTLEKKARHYEKIIEDRHERRGIINRSHLAVPGDLTSNQVQNQDNDGLWTATFLIAECYRYAVTKEADAKAKAIRTFEALERLETVTGISGYPARSYVRIEDDYIESRSPHAKKWHVSPDGEWRWLDDTSSDEITGHMYSIALFCELVADESYRRRAIQLLERIMDHIIDNDFQLIDEDGKPTRWGIWNPDSLNLSPRWAYERGLNSLQVLSYLKIVYHLTGKEKYNQVYHTLIQDHGYAENALRAKVHGPFEISHSDDILNFFPYYGLTQYTKDDPYRKVFQKSLQRTWNAVSKDHMPVWNVMASAWLNQNCGITMAQLELEEYPLNLIDWSVRNSHRWDLDHHPMPDRMHKKQSIQRIPADENQIFRWNTNPKQLDAGYQGKREVSGTYYLVAYWMGRYHGLFK